MTERDWSGALATAFQRHLDLSGSGGSSGSGGEKLKQAIDLRPAPPGTTTRRAVVPVVPHASGPAMVDKIGTTGTTIASRVVPESFETESQQLQEVAGDGTTGTTGTTKIEVIRAAEAERCSGPVPDAEDWQAVYFKRAAVREFDGGLPRGQAERLAHADTVTELREPPPGVQMTAPLATGVSTFPTSAGSELDLTTARRRGPWWDGPAWDEPRFSVGIMAEWQLGLQRLSPHREPCPGFRSGQWLRVYEASLRFLAEHGPAAAAQGWSTLDLFGVDPGVGVARVSCCGALMVSGGSPVVGVAAHAIRHRNGLAFRKSALPDAAVAVWDYAWPEAGR